MATRTVLVLVAACSAMAAGAAVREVPLKSPNPVFAVAPMPLDAERVDVQDVDLQIVGGKDATVGQFPYQVSMQVTRPGTLWLNRKPAHLCGGSLVSEGWVLTAAHCVWGVPQTALKVEAVLGIANLKEDRIAGAQRILVTRMLAHSKYDHYASDGIGPFDIGMLKLARKAKLTDTVNLVKLPVKNAIPEGEATLSGWGSTSSDGMHPVYPNQLQTAVFPIVPYEECRDFFVKSGSSVSGQLRDTNLCTGSITAPGLSSCSGDSGGPLVQTSDADPKETTVVGIVSWGLVNCGSVPYPSIFTRASAFVDWIKEVQEKY